MPSFQERIKMIVPKSNARQVEGVMRAEKQGNLDTLTDAAFYALCLEADKKAKEDPQKATYFADVYRLRNEDV